MRLIFIDKRHECGDVWTFRFRPVATMDWRAGQSIRLELPAGYDTDERRFTISSAPREGFINITTRLSQSDFKQALSQLSPGDEAQGYAVEGNFQWQDSGGPHLLIGFGVGVTPYRAMLSARQGDKNSPNATLLQVAKPSEVVFGEEFEAWSTSDPRFHYRKLAREALPEALGEFLESLPEPTVYLSGSAQTVDEYYRTLSSRLPAECIIRDRFTGRVGWDEP